MKVVSLVAQYLSISFNKRENILPRAEHRRRNDVPKRNYIFPSDQIHINVFRIVVVSVSTRENLLQMFFFFHLFILYFVRVLIRREIQLDEY